jgi:Transposase zinc-ribbon domain
MPTFASRVWLASASGAYAALPVVTRGRPSLDSDSGIFLGVAGRLLDGDRLTSTVRIRFAPFDFSRSVAGVARPAYPPTILVFQEHFATEEACREYLFASRWPDGFRWSRCGGERAGEDEPPPVGLHGLRLPSAAHRGGPSCTGSEFARLIVEELEYGE